MKLIDYSVLDFVKELDSAKPAPGGGSASAVAAALGMALSRMVGHLTISKKKFKALDDYAQESFIDIHEQLKDNQRKALKLVDEDTLAFNQIMKAFKMPKESNEEKKERKKAIEKATYKATEVPLEIAEISFETLKKLQQTLKHANKNAISDIGVSALLLHSALEGAILNVKINLPGISDESYKEKTVAKVKSMQQEGHVVKEALLKMVNEHL